MSISCIETMRRSFTRIGLTMCVALLTAAIGNASSIVLISVNSGVYDYALHMAAGEFNQFAAGSTALTLSGMSGVVNSSAAGALDFCLHGVPITPSTATRVADSPGGCGMNNPLAVPQDLGDWFITSASGATGLVDYSILSASGVFTGQVQGPVAAAAVPEPSTIALLFVGFLLVFVRRIFL